MKKIVAIGDLHSGSMYAPMPQGFETYDGTCKTQNPAQEYLWRCWDDFTWRCHKYDPDIIIVNGDVVEGPQRKSNGFEVTLPAASDQIECAVQTLRHLKGRVRPDCRWFFTRGTPYHVGDFGDTEEAIAKQIGAEPYGSVGVGKYAREVLWGKVDGITIEVTHHPAGSSTGFYRLTVLDRDSQWAAMAAKDHTKGVPKAHLLLRSHLHFFGRAEHASKLCVMLPCWKLGDRHSRKGGLHRFIPDIGGCFINVDSSALERGEEPCVIQKELYSLPPVPVVEL